MSDSLCGSEGFLSSLVADDFELALALLGWTVLSSPLAVDAAPSSVDSAPVIEAVSGVDGTVGALLPSPSAAAAL